MTRLGQEMPRVGTMQPAATSIHRNWGRRKRPDAPARLPARRPDDACQYPAFPANRNVNNMLPTALGRDREGRHDKEQGRSGTQTLTPQCGQASGFILGYRTAALVHATREQRHFFRGKIRIDTFIAGMFLQTQYNFLTDIKASSMRTRTSPAPSTVAATVGDFHQATWIFAADGMIKKDKGQISADGDPLQGPSD